MPKINFVHKVLICSFFSFLQVYAIFSTQIIYIPVLFTVLFSFSYGILEPKKGWILSIIQTCLIIGMYWLNISLNIKATNPDMAIFATHIAIFPSFVAAYLGSFIKRL